MMEMNEFTVVVVDCDAFGGQWRLIGKEKEKEKKKKGRSFEMTVRPTNFLVFNKRKSTALIDFLKNGIDNRYR